VVVLRYPYDFTRIRITLHQEQPHRWTFGGHQEVGVAYEYEVRDSNYPSLNAWTFRVSVPEATTGRHYKLVQPFRKPNRRCWTGIERASISLPPATKPRYRSKLYAKLFIGVRRKLVPWAEVRRLPPWFKNLEIRKKGTVIFQDPVPTGIHIPSCC